MKVLIALMILATPFFDKSYALSHGAEESSEVEAIIQLPDKFEHPYKSYETIDYKASFGSGKVNCVVTEYGRVYTCILVKPCAPLGNTPCGCGENICQP